ncbi:MAG: diacylglycerol kinase family lipid kinase [Nitrospirae bacterium]|nr:diacylglycerol kinase family lipid kinase [Nitrospirota bacterium]
MRRSSVLLIANPTAGSFTSRKIDKARDIFRQAGMQLDTYLTQKAGDAEHRAREAVNGGYAMVIAGGGDGTVNEVVNGLAFSSLPMSILPMGITNVLAREVGIPQGAKGAAMAIVNGRQHRVSLGRLDQSGTSRYFILMAGIGFDGRVVHETGDTAKSLLGAASFVLRGIECLLNLKAPKLVVDADGKRYTGYTVIVCNASKYGGDFRIAPEADITVPTLWVRVFGGPGRVSILKNTLALVTGFHGLLFDGDYFACKRLTIEGRAYVQVDGDARGESPVEITVQPEALSLIY